MPGIPYTKLVYVQSGCCFRHVCSKVVVLCTCLQSGCCLLHLSTERLLSLALNCLQTNRLSLALVYRMAVVPRTCLVMLLSLALVYSQAVVPRTCLQTGCCLVHLSTARLWSFALVYSQAVSCTCLQTNRLSHALVCRQPVVHSINWNQFILHLTNGTSICVTYPTVKSSLNSVNHWIIYVYVINHSWAVTVCTCGIPCVIAVYCIGSNCI